ncbi:hypothetical protein TTHERM_000298239 (macronuclear) [Tetrahymena thermophila SB210]|uniref:Uncharacterized protein n=1 Tax=Tetrahymena thermophila (strain SB210) TaxID=312017 RepID=W7XG80_TETTS|nr:hypothetical protein TTHERM_000298239 [Tetrahymena thermophila SB210]EWS71844.1 hypothetical protein TTHERM_000298239 [Tetrahymena thermophila SB210]|eukprot:XP_012655588.1 hypothetical protein TTHERM_000298239 [Tetrahymena thermophila SB210]
MQYFRDWVIIFQFLKPQIQRKFSHLLIQNARRFLYYVNCISKKMQKKTKINQKYQKTKFFSPNINRHNRYQSEQIKFLFLRIFYKNNFRYEFKLVIFLRQFSQSLIRIQYLINIESKIKQNNKKKIKLKNTKKLKMKIKKKIFKNELNQVNKQLLKQKSILITLQTNKIKK